MFHQSVLIITLICSWSAQAIEGPSCSVEVCGSPQRCSSGENCSLCQGHTIVCTCVVDGIALGWTNEQFSNQPGGIPFISPMDSATSSDSATGAVAQVTDVGKNGATIVNISSTLTLNVTSDQFNRTRIGCYDGTGPTNAQTVTLDLRDPPPPDRPTVQFNNPGQSFTVSWNNTASPFNGYNVTVSPFNPCTQSPDVGCNTAYVCSGWSASNQPNMFQFSVNAVCGSVVGSGSAAASVNLQAPEAPTNFNYEPNCTFVDIFWEDPNSMEEEIYRVINVSIDCISCIPQSLPESRPVSSNNPFRIDAVPGETYTVTLALINNVGRSQDSDTITIVNNVTGCPTVLSPTTRTSTTTPPTSPTVTTSGSPDIAPAIGGAVGGVVLLLLLLIIAIIVFLIWLKKEDISRCGKITIMIILCLTVVGIILVIAILIQESKTKKVSLKFPSSDQKGVRDSENVELKESTPDNTSAPALYADPNVIEREEHPGTGDLYTMPDKARKTHKQEDHLPTYQDPHTISHETAPTGEEYALPDKKPKKGAKQAETSRPTEDQLAEMYSQPDKSRKQQNQGLQYTQVAFNISGKAPDTVPGVVYSDVTKTN